MSRPSPSVARIGALPKSKSGPSSSAGGQFAAGAGGAARLKVMLQPTTKTSFAVTCDVHLIAPLSRSNAMMASLVGCCGSVYMLPVAAYTTWRFGSIAGDDQMPAPDGPHRVVPLAFLPTGFASALIVYVFHTSDPVAASSATRLPRKVQHSYFAFSPCPSSLDAIGTYRRC